MFVALRADYPALAALHPVNGMLLLLVVIAIARDAWRRSSVVAPAPQAASVATEAVTAQ